jgi:drug/metabolite transporter (DMT)-like permease
LVFLAANGQLSLIGHLSFEQTLWIEITSFVLFGYMITWYSGLRHVPVSVAAAILLLGSPITTFMTFVSTGKISLGEIFSGGLIIFGLILILGYQIFLERIKQFGDKINVRS